MFPVIHVGSIQTYNLFLLGGILTGWFFFLFDEYRSVINGQSQDSSWLFLKTTLIYIIIVVFCIQGANYFHYFFDNIPEKIKPLGTSKVLYGTVFFYPLGVLAATLFSKQKKFYNYLNQKTFILFIILGFARMGCFSNGCCYGIRSDFLGLRFPRGSVASFEHLRQGFTHGFVAPPSLPVIPTQLISAVVHVIIALFAWRSFQKKSSKHTFLKCVFIYAVFRFLIEFIRDDLERAYWSFLSASQWISVFIFCCFGLYYITRKLILKKI